MSYDHWKTTNRTDEFLGPVPTKTVPCDDCGGEGRISYSHGNDPSPKYCGWCETCSGYGTVEQVIEEPNP